MGAVHIRPGPSTAGPDPLAPPRTTTAAWGHDLTDLTAGACSTVSVLLAALGLPAGAGRAAGPGSAAPRCACSAAVVRGRRRAHLVRGRGRRGRRHGARPVASGAARPRLARGRGRGGGSAAPAPAGRTDAAGAAAGAAAPRAARRLEVVCARGRRRRVAFVAYAAVHLAAPSALGAGDVKLAAPLGAVLAAASWAALGGGRPARRASERRARGGDARDARSGRCGAARPVDARGRPPRDHRGRPGSVRGASRAPRCPLAGTAGG